MDCSLPGSSVHGILQARVLEWGAIAFSIFLPTNYYLKMFFIIFNPSKSIIAVDGDCLLLL